MRQLRFGQLANMAHLLVTLVATMGERDQRNNDGQKSPAEGCWTNYVDNARSGIHSE